jgi:hypothetical protein
MTVVTFEITQSNNNVQIGDTATLVAPAPDQIVVDVVGTVLATSPGQSSVEIALGASAPITSAPAVVLQTEAAVIEAGGVGFQGPPGPSVTGPPGPAGPIGPAGSSFTYIQSVSSAVWTIVHNLGMFPNIAVIDSAGSHVEGDQTYVDPNTVVLTFAAAFTGTAYLS